MMHLLLSLAKTLQRILRLMSCCVDSSETGVTASKCLRYMVLTC